MCDTKYCPKCSTTLPVADFYKTKGRGDGLSPYCRECTRAVNRKWSHENPRSIRLAMRNRYAKARYPQLQAQAARAAVELLKLVKRLDADNPLRPELALIHALLVPAPGGDA